MDKRKAVRAAGPTPKAVNHELGRRRDPVLILADGVVDLSAVKALVSEWLVPLLIRDFLAEQDTIAKVHTQKPTTELLGEEGAAKGRIR